ncbi:hypothetical protein Tco_0269707 [Tanacetum coccineum]
MSGTHLVAGDYRWGKNPSRSFPSEYSPATCRWGYKFPQRHVAGERPDMSPGKRAIVGSARTTSSVDLEEFCEKHYQKLLPIMADKYGYEQKKKEKLEEVKARLNFGDARKKSTRAQESAYSESRTISPRRQRRFCSLRHNPSVFTRLRRERSRSPRMNTRARQEGKVSCSRDSEAENRAHPRTPIAVRKAQGIRKITLKAKIVKEGTGSLNYEKKVQCRR